MFVDSRNRADGSREAATGIELRWSANRFGVYMVLSPELLVLPVLALPVTISKRLVGTEVA